MQNHLVFVGGGFLFLSFFLSVRVSEFDIGWHTGVLLKKGSGEGYWNVTYTSHGFQELE